MPGNQAILHLFCGQIAAGKSTLAAHISAEERSVLVSEDSWLSRLYPGEIVGLEDYVRCSGHLKEAMGPHVEALLCAGLSVVLDFPANTLQQRAWLRGLYDAAGAAHRLHYLDIPDATCRIRLRQRNLEAAHDFAPSDEDFDLIAGYFVPPTQDEGFDIIRHSVG